MNIWLLLLTIGLAIGISCPGIQEHELEEYASFLRKFDKDLARINECNRVRQFKISINLIESENKRRSSQSFRLAINHFADLFPNEIDNMFSSNTLPRYDRSVLNSSSLDRLLLTADDSPTHLNWATRDNAYGHPVISPVRNQGTCGACWAFVAAAATEATVHYNTGKRVYLSVQELIDCDTLFNRGCKGGNPENAFNYISESGLGLWDDLPYKCAQEYCEGHNPMSTRAMIQGYVRIPSTQITSLQGLLAMAPIAAGICGTSPSFVYYSSGIFDDPICCSVQNHAVLIVGYGHDTSLNTDYWVVQNSWSHYWGENGFIRIKRTPYNSTGICGLTSSLSMPYGGYLLHDTSNPIDDEHSNSNKRSDDIGATDDTLNWKSFFTLLPFWIRQNWQKIIIVLSMFVLVTSLSTLVFIYCSEFWIACCKRRKPQYSNRRNTIELHNHYNGHSMAMMTETDPLTREVSA